jgi:hypothetical protein
MRAGRRIRGVLDAPIEGSAEPSAVSGGGWGRPEFQCEGAAAMARGANAWLGAVRWISGE